MKICENCGASNQENNSFCSTCGYRIEEKVLVKICENCGTSNQGSNNFCSSCGCSLGAGTNSMPKAKGKAEYKITFQRPKTFQMSMNVFHIKVDGGISYELSNGGEITLTLSPGQHTIEMSVFAMPRKKRFNLYVTNNTTLICKPAIGAAITFWAVPIKVNGSNGREY